MTLELLPSALVAAILSKLDISSLCSVAAVSKLLHANVSQLLGFISDFCLLDIAPTLDLLLPLLPQNPYLRILKLDCSQLDDSSIGHLARPSLHEVCLYNCNSFSGKLLSELGKHCSDLRSLSLGNIAQRRGCEILVSELEDLLSGCHKLEVLNLLFDVSTFSRHSFAHIWDHAAKSLLSLEVGFVTSVMMTELLQLKVVGSHFQSVAQPRAMVNIQKLSLLVDYITDSLISTISEGLISLTYLDLQDTHTIEPEVSMDLTNYGLQQINQNGKLKHLSLVRIQESIMTYFKRVNDLGILLMADRCSNLESICLGGFCQVTDTGIRAILHSCPHLQKLRVSHGTRLTDLVFHDISATSLSLTHVGLAWCSLLTSSAFMSLALNKDLKILDVRGCRSLGDEALMALASLPNLEILLLDGSDITDMGLSYLVQSAALMKSLSVRGCKRLTDACLEVLFKSCFGRNIQALNLSNVPGVTDDGILSLAKSGASITELRLRECPHIGDISVMALASMQIKGLCGSSLRLLDIYGCGGITRLAIHWLKKPYFPRLTWLGISNTVNRDLVDILARNRPFMHLVCHGEELESGYWNNLDGFCRGEYEEIDELEQWLLDGEYEGEDIEMVTQVTS